MEHESNSEAVMYRYVNQMIICVLSSAKNNFSSIFVAQVTQVTQKSGSRLYLINRREKRSQSQSH